jgi:hypothetical protein
VADPELCGQSVAEAVEKLFWAIAKIESFEANVGIIISNTTQKINQSCVGRAQKSFSTASASRCRMRFRIVGAG